MCIVNGYIRVDFLEFFPGNRNHHHFSDDVCCHDLQLVCQCEIAHCEVEDEDAACGFPWLCGTAQFCDRHSSGRIGDLVVDVVDASDISVSETVGIPPSEHLAFFRRTRKRDFCAHTWCLSLM